MKKRITKLIGGLTVGRKLALIYFLDLTAVIFISGILIHEKFIAINFSDKEVLGNHYIAAVRDALIAIVPPSPPDSAIHLQLKQQADAVTRAEALYGKDMGSADLARNFSAALQRVRPGEQGEADSPSGDAFAQGRALLTRIGNQSNLILDPDLDSYYTMSLLVLRFPELLELLDRTGDLAARLPRIYDDSR